MSARATLADVTDPVRLRPARADDREFLTDILEAAFNWLPGRVLSRERIVGDPEISHYVGEWPRPGDFGAVAEDPRGNPVGACWVRFFDATEPGYGYVADDVPEMTIGVVDGWRGLGIGRRLIRAVLAAARERRIDRVSLSVEDGNRAKALYDSEGFVFVATVDGSHTMVAPTGPR